MSLTKDPCTHPLCQCKAYCQKPLVYRNERESAKPPNEPTSRVDVEAIKQEIRELDSLRFVESNEFSAHYSEFVYHRINELLDLLDSAD